MDRKEIKIVERPSSVSWEEISAVLKESHLENVNKGINLPYPALPPNEIYAKTEGSGGIMLVALDGEKVVGTSAVIIIDKDLWCGSGKYAYCCFASVLPEYRGTGIYRQFSEWREKYARKMGVDRLMYDTDERNVRVISVTKENGFRPVEYRVREGRNSVVFVKWLKKCPYSKLNCVFHFLGIKYLKKIISSMKNN